MLCVIAKIDEESRMKLYKLQKAAEDEFGIEPRYLHGHVTLLTYVGGDEEELTERCSELLKGQEAFSFQYDRVSVLEESSIIVAEAVRCCALEELHEKLLAVGSEFLNSWTGREQWTPHTTLLHDPKANLEEIAAVMKKDFRSFEAHVDRIEFSAVTDSGYEIRASVPLTEH